MSEFENEELKKIYEESFQILEMNKMKMNNISRDIRQLEKFLNENVLANHSMEILVNDNPYLLCWNGDRLCLVDRSKAIKCLIETKMNIRLGAHKYLAPFMKEIIQKTI